MVIRRIVPAPGHQRRGDRSVPSSPVPVYHRGVSAGDKDHPIDLESTPYDPSSLVDLIGMLMDGWQIAHLRYADHCDIPGGRVTPAAFIALERSDQTAWLVIVDDGRSVSHTNLITLFRDHPNVWKHRSGADIDRTMSAPDTPPVPAEEWGDFSDASPDELDLSPGGLRGVVCVNQSQAIDGVTVAITSLERFAGGARAHYLCHAPGRRFREQAGALDAIAVDDGARLYRVASMGQHQRGNRIEGALGLVPAIPHDARTLTITIGNLGPGANGQPQPGPWVFPIGLDTAS